jgi:hypothetical protein
MIFDKLFKRKKTEDEINIEPVKAEPADETADEPTGEPSDETADAVTDEPSDDQAGQTDADATAETPAEAEASGLPAPHDEGSELDRQLNKMLDEDKKADADFEMMDASGLVQSTAIFDGSMEAEMKQVEWESYARKKERRERALPLLDTGLAPPRNLRERLTRMSVPAVLIIGLLIIAAVGGVGFGVIVLTTRMLATEAEKQTIAHFTPITQPLSVANNGNFIFLDHTVALNDESFTLLKISVGAEATMAFFGQQLDLEKYSFTLTDQNNNLYMRRSYGILPQDGKNTVLEFEPLRTNTVFITLTVHDNESGDETAFFYRFTETPRVVPPIYYNKPLPLITEENGLSLNVSRVVLSNTATEIFYDVNTDSGSAIRFNTDEINSLLGLYQGVHLIPLLGSTTPSETQFEPFNTTVGKLTFAPVPYIDRKAQLVFNNLYYSYDLSSRAVDSEKLFNYNDNAPQTFVTGNHRLILEAMALQGTLLIMVAHAEDENGERVQAALNATVSVMINGETLTVAGNCYSGPEGSDIVFDLTDVYRSFAAIPLSEYKITIDAVEYLIPKLTVELDLTAGEALPERFIGSAEPFIETAFLRRLAYKSGLLEEASVRGFTDDIMADRTLARYYQPAGVTEMPKFNAEVVSGIISENNTFIGVVEEEWVVGSGVDLTRMHLKHRVICERYAGNWIITSDELI